MSFANFTDARQEIIDAFLAKWTPTGFFAQYPNVKGDPPTGIGTPEDPVSWARLTINHVGSEQATLAEVGCRTFTRFGVLEVQIFTPSGDGSRQSDILAQIVADAFEGKTTPNRVFFRNVSPPIEIGNSGLWYQVNISADFEYDGFK